MPCSPYDAFKMATESLSEELYLRASWRGLFINLIPRDQEYPKGTGLTQTSFTMGRNEPETEEERWERITSSMSCATDAKTGSEGYCRVCWNDTKWGFEEGSWSPEQFGLRGPILCQDDLIFNFNAERFLELYLRALTKRSARSLENRLQNIYIHLAPKWIADASFAMDQTGGSFTNGVAPQVPDLTNLPVATSEVTQEMLDEVAIRLIEDGATDPDTDGWITLGPDGPIFPLLIGMRASQQVNLNTTAFREDYRQAEPSALLKRLGATRSIKNFRHVVTPFPKRYIYVSQAGFIGYVNVPVWIMEASSKGFVATVNPQWRTAPFEACHVLSPWVFHSHPIRPVNSAAGLNWNPKSYMGEWEWVTGGKEICEDDETEVTYDPTKKLGRHFGEYKHAAEPIFPEYGATIIFRRCPTTNFEIETCDS